MLRIEKVVLPSDEQYEFAVQCMRNAKNSWDMSDSEYRTYNNENYGYVIGEKDHELMMKLAKAGTEHRKYMRQLPVGLRLTTNQPVWAEFDTYKIGTVRNSCSKMHKIHVCEFKKDMFSHEGIDEVGGIVEEQFRNTLNTLELLRNAYNATEENKYWRAIIELLPSGYNLTANVTLNYEVLSNIYRQRRGHKMFEWHILCDWIETLPYSDIITFKVV